MYYTESRNCYRPAHTVPAHTPPALPPGHHQRLNPTTSLLLEHLFRNAAYLWTAIKPRWKYCKLKPTSPKKSEALTCGAAPRPLRCAAVRSRSQTPRSRQPGS